MAEDFYVLLGVGRDANDSDLKSAYRKLAMKYHPDRNPGDADAEAKFKEISQAYAVLSEPDKRKAYDQFGHAAFEGGGGAGGGFGFDFSSSFSDVFDDLFGDFMGGGARQQRSRGTQRGADLRYNLEISLDDAFRGRKTQIRVPSTVICEICNGVGAEPGTEPIACSMCQGHGKVRQQSGFFTVERTCPSCGGAGRTIKNPCATCTGGGRVARERTLAVNVPAGVEDGTRIRLADEGEAGLRGGAAGDLYIFVSVSSHPVYEREGEHLFCKVPIAMTTAVLGGKIEVPTLDGGKVAVSIPEGTQTGKQFRLNGRGMPHLRGRGRGDLYLETLVETPVNLSKKQKALLKEFAEMAGDDISPESTGFIDRVRQFLDGMND